MTLPTGRRYDDAPLSTSTTDNWVARRGGLPPYVRAVTRGILKSGTAATESEAIQIAIGRMSVWARGGGGVTAKTAAKAAAALAQWEALKATAGSNDSRDAVLELGSAGLLLPKAQPDGFAPHLYKPSGRPGVCRTCGQPASNLMHTAALARPRRGSRHAGKAGHAPVKGGHVKSAEQHVLATARTVDRHATALEGQASAVMGRLFDRQRDTVVSRLKGRRGLAMVRAAMPAPQPDDQQPAPIVEPSTIFDTAYWAGVTEDALQGVYDSAATLTAGRLGDSLHPNLPTPPQAAQSVADVLKQRAATVGAQITQTTYAKIAEQITEGLTAGEHIDQLAQRIGTVFDDATANRAELIARTESISALNTAADSYATALPPGMVAYKQWLAVEDARTRPAHAAADGQQQNVGTPFLVGGITMQHPGDPTAPPDEVCNCRCTAVYMPRRLAAVQDF